MRHANPLARFAVGLLAAIVVAGWAAILIALWPGVRDVLDEERHREQDDELPRVPGAPRVNCWTKERARA